MESVMQTVLDGDWATMTKYVEKMAASKLKNRIAEKKQQIVDRLNAGFDSEQ